MNEENSKLKCFELCPIYSTGPSGSEIVTPLWAASRASWHGFSSPTCTSIRAAAMPTGPRRAIPPMAFPRVTVVPFGLTTRAGSASVPTSLKFRANFPRLNLILIKPGRPVPPFGVSPKVRSSFSVRRSIVPPRFAAAVQSDSGLSVHWNRFLPEPLSSRKTSIP